MLGIEVSIQCVSLDLLAATDGIRASAVGIRLLRFIVSIGAKVTCLA